MDSNFEDFSETSTGFSVVAGRRLWSPHWDADLTYRFSYTTIGETDPFLPPIFQTQEGSRILSTLTPRILYDTRDSRIQASRGMIAEASLELGGGPFGGSLDWVRPSLDVARYFTMYKLKNGGRHILELHGRAALIEAYLGTKEVPPFQRYYGGGISDVRGFQNRSITPYVNGFPVGGKKSLSATAEYSVPVYEEIVRASVFMDAGQVWDAGKPDPGTTVTNRSGLRASIGLGLAIRTPLSPLPIRVYFSKAIARNDEDQLKSFDFSFGTRF